MIPRILTLTALVLSAIYAYYSIDSMVLHNKTPYSFQCLGVKLDPKKNYVFSNNDRDSIQNSVLITFPYAEAIMPENLGVLSFNSTISQWQLILSNNIAPDDNLNKDIFKPFCVLNKKSRWSKFEFLKPSSIVSQNELERGLKFNTKIGGDAKTRVPVNLISHNGAIYLDTKSEGLSIQYYLTDSMHLDLALNHETSNTHLQAFQFNNLTLDTALIDFKCISSIFNSKVVVSDSVSQPMIYQGEEFKFEKSGFLFNVKPKMTENQFYKLCFCLAFILLISIKIYFDFGKTENPLKHSVYSIVIGINCCCFLAMPLFITSFSMIENREYYIYLFTLLNMTYFLPSYWLVNFNLTKWKYFGSVLSIFLLLLFTALLFLTKSESLFNIPVLHVAKFLIIGCVFFLYLFLDIPILKYIFIILISLVISISTSDFGSLIFTSIATLTIALIYFNRSYKWSFLFLSISLIVVTLLYNYSSSNKVFRFVAPYLTEAITSSDFEQSDRESYVSYSLNFKDMITDSSSRFKDVVIPAQHRSTFHSDFATFWSFKYGGYFFLCIYLLVLFIMSAEIGHMLYASLLSIRVRKDKDEFFVLTKSPTADMTSYLLGLTLVQITYPVFSNFLSAPLTGQTSLIGISNIEVIFIALFILILRKVFFSPIYYTMKNQDSISYFSIHTASKKFSKLWLVLIVSFIGFAYYLSSDRPNIYEWKKQLKDKSLNSIMFPADSSKCELENYALKLIEPKDFLEKWKVPKIDKKLLPTLRDLICRYWNDKPYRSFHMESVIYENDIEKVHFSTILDSVYSLRKFKISGITAPFGDVFTIYQKMNGSTVMRSTNEFYRTINPITHKTVNADLTAELNQAIQQHMPHLFGSKNFGAITIVNHHNGHIISNASSDLNSMDNINQRYFMVGSIKKYLLAYSSLAINPTYRSQVYGDKETFQDLIVKSKDSFAGFLLKDVLTFHKEEFANILKSDFDLNLYSRVDDAYLDSTESRFDFNSKMDYKNVLYRIAIGQQKSYSLIDFIQHFARMASGKKVKLTYNTLADTVFEPMSLNPYQLTELKLIGSKVLTEGTARKQGLALTNFGVDLNGLWAKTGTAELSKKLKYLNSRFYPNSNKTINSSSSFIISNNQYTIGICLQGLIPDNDDEAGAKHLFENIIPILIKYQILK